ncbi:MAG: hypothetical protein K2L38_03955 [Dysosmobacter sp.]|nr:hypothetical protein [Dysosmobacter sp.]
MSGQFWERLGKLLSVKSLVTLTLTAVFSCLALRGGISQEFMTVYAVVIAFYFGTQAQKVYPEAGSRRNGEDGDGGN